MKNSSPSQTSSECPITFSQSMMARNRSNNYQQFPFCLIANAWQAHDDPPSRASVWAGYHGDVQVSFKDLSNAHQLCKLVQISFDELSRSKSDHMDFDIQLCGQEQGRADLLRRVSHHDHPSQGDQLYFSHLAFNFLNGWWIDIKCWSSLIWY